MLPALLIDLSKEGSSWHARSSKGRRCDGSYGEVGNESASMYAIPVAVFVAKMYKGVMSRVRHHKHPCKQYGAVIRPAASGVLLLDWSRFEGCFPHSHTLTSYIIIGHAFSLYLSLPCLYYLVCSMLSVSNVLSVHDTNNSYFVSAASSFSPIKMQPSQYRSSRARLFFQASFMCVLPVALAVLCRLNAYQSGVQ